MFVLYAVFCLIQKMCFVKSISLYDLCLSPSPSPPLPPCCVPVFYGGHMEVRGQRPDYFHLLLWFEIVLFAKLAGLQASRDSLVCTSHVGTLGL